jgi:hypothetical protein
MAGMNSIFDVWVVASVIFVLAVIGIKFLYGAKARKKSAQDRDTESRTGTQK